MATWAMQLSRIRRRLQDNGDSQYWQDAELMEIANFAQRQIAIDIEWKRGTAYLNLIAGSGKHAIPTGVYSIKVLEETEGGPLTHSNSRDIRAEKGTGWRTQTGTPAAYYRDTVGEGYFILWPAPMGEATTVATPGSLNNTTDPVSVAITAGDGANYDVGDYLAVWDSTTYDVPTEDPAFEVVKITAISTDTLTLARAQDGTSAVAHAGSPGIALATLDGLSLDYVGLPTDITLPTDTVDIPVDADNAFLYLVMSECYEKEQDRQNLQLAEGFAMKYDRERRKLLGRAAREFDYVPRETIVPLGMV